MNKPAHHPLSIADPEVIECPYAAYAKLRDEAPVYLDPVTNFYVLTRYEDIQAVIRKPRLFVNENWPAAMVNDVKRIRDERADARFRKEGWVPGPSIGALGFDRHEKVRAVFNQAFRTGAIRQHEPFIRDTAYDLARSFAARGEGEFVSEFAIPFPLRIITRLVGIPSDDGDKVKAWTASWLERFGMMLTDEQDYAAVGTEIEFQHYTKELIDRLRREPDGSLLSDIVNIPLDDGGHLSDNELFTHLQADLIVAGFETTQNTMSAGVMLLAQYPEVNERVRADPDRYLRIFVEEVLRLESPNQGMFRVAAEETEMHGVTIPKGALLHLRWGAANRDPSKFGECPERIDLDHGSMAHMAFGGGPYSCVGAPLARAELYWGFKALIDTIDHIELLPENDFSHLQSIIHRGLKSLKIRFTTK